MASIEDLIENLVGYNVDLTDTEKNNEYVLLFALSKIQNVANFIRSQIYNANELVALAALIVDVNAKKNDSAAVIGNAPPRYFDMTVNDRTIKISRILLLLMLRNTIVTNKVAAYAITNNNTIVTFNAAGETITNFINNTTDAESNAICDRLILTAQCKEAILFAMTSKKIDKVLTKLQTVIGGVPPTPGDVTANFTLFYSLLFQLNWSANGNNLHNVADWLNKIEPAAGGTIRAAATDPVIAYLDAIVTGINAVGNNDLRGAAIRETALLKIELGKTKEDSTHLRTLLFNMLGNKYGKYTLNKYEPFDQYNSNYLNFPFNPAILFFQGVAAQQGVVLNYPFDPRSLIDSQWGGGNKYENGSIASTYFKKYKLLQKLLQDRKSKMSTNTSSQFEKTIDNIYKYESRIKDIYNDIQNGGSITNQTGGKYSVNYKALGREIQKALDANSQVLVWLLKDGLSIAYHFSVNAKANANNKITPSYEGKPYGQHDNTYKTEIPEIPAGLGRIDESVTAQTLLYTALNKYRNYINYKGPNYIPNLINTLQTNIKNHLAAYNKTIQHQVAADNVVVAAAAAARTARAAATAVAAAPDVLAAATATAATARTAAATAVAADAAALAAANAAVAEAAASAAAVIAAGL